MWSLPELFSLAISSNGGRDVVRHLTSSLNPPLKISDVEGASGILELSREGGTPCKIRCFDEPTFIKMIENHDEEYPRFFTFQQYGTEMKMTFLSETDAICVVKENLELASLLLVEFFTDVFSANFENLTISIERQNLGALITEGLQSDINFQVLFGHVSYQEMQLILDQKCYTADLGCFVRHGFVYNKPISVPNLAIRFAHWFTRDNLLSLDSARICLGDSILKSEDINAFITKWLLTDNDKLEHFAMCESAPNTMEAQDLSVIINGLPQIRPFDKSRFISTLKLKNQVIDYDKGIDIRRASDGMLATIVYSKNPQGLCFFAFVVWKTPMPSEEASESETLNQFQQLSISDEQAELRRILETPHDEFHLSHDMGKNFIFENAINVRNLKIDHSQWLTVFNLLTLNSETVTLSKCNLKNLDLNAFLHQWINSDNKTLWHFIADFEDSDQPLDINVITDGMLTEPGSDKSEMRLRYGESFTNSIQIPYQNGLDITRDSDGITATVLVDKTIYGKDRFVFTVWK